MLPKQRVPFFKRRFIQRLAVLSGGLAAGQAIILLVSPILTRLYTPSEFGVYALFTALNAIFINLASLRYELAIPVARTDRDAAALACVALLAVSSLSLAGMPVVWLAGDWLAGFAGMPLMAQALWLLPLVVAVYSAGDVISHWSIYRATFRLNAAGRVIQSGAQSVLQVGLGLLGYHGWGLLIGFVLGCFVRLGVLVWWTAPADRRLIARASSGRMAKLARANWQYPAFSTPASLLEASTQLLPLLFIAALFGPAFAGLYGLGQRLMGLPVRLFASAARNVFLGEAGQRQPMGLYRLFKRSSLLFLGLGVAGLSPILLFGPTLFAVVFGEAWRRLGRDRPAAGAPLPHPVRGHAGLAGLQHPWAPTPPPDLVEPGCHPAARERHRGMVAGTAANAHDPTVQLGLDHHLLALFHPGVAGGAAAWADRRTAACRRVRGRRGRRSQPSAARLSSRAARHPFR